MHSSHRQTLPWIALVLFLLLSACGGRPPALSTALEDKDPVEQLVSLESDLDAARQEDLNVLSPRYFAKAERLYQEAQSMLEQETDLSEILLKITSGRVELQRSEQAAQIARTVLADVIKVRQLALAAGAADLGPEYTTTEERFLRLTQAIEDNDLDSAQKDKAKVFDAFDQLELRAIKERNLGEAHRLLDQANANRASRQAPWLWPRHSKNSLKLTLSSPTDDTSGKKFVRKLLKPSFILTAWSRSCCRAKACKTSPRNRSPCISRGCCIRQPSS